VPIGECEWHGWKRREVRTASAAAGADDSVVLDDEAMLTAGDSCAVFSFFGINTESKVSSISSRFVWIGSPSNMCGAALAWSRGSTGRSEGARTRRCSIKNW
jgi:hypothetical protein